MIKIVSEKTIEPFNSSSGRYLIIDENFFIELLDKYPKQSVILYLYYIKYILLYDRIPNKNELFKISGFNVEIFNKYYKKIAKLLNIEDENKETIIDNGEPIKRKRNSNIQIVRDSILFPYYEELKKAGYGALLNDESVKKDMFRKIRSFYSKNKEIFSPDDVLEILKIGLRDEYLIKKGVNCNLSYVFKAILPKYLEKKNNGYKVHKKLIFIDNNGNELDPSQFGYWEITESGSLIFIEPKNKMAKYWKFKKEYLKRLEGDGNSEYDYLFNDDGSVKEEYEWCFGLAGKNNRFIKEI